MALVASILGVDCKRTLTPEEQMGALEAGARSHSQPVAGRGNGDDQAQGVARASSNRSNGAARAAAGDAGSAQAGAEHAASESSPRPMDASEPVGADADAGPDNPAPQTLGYGWGEITGPAIGDGSASATELRKVIEVKLGGESDYMIAKAYAVRTSTTSTATGLIVEVKNVGTRMRCFVKAQPFVRKTAKGEVIPDTTDFCYVSGSIGIRDDLLTDTCLAPGQRGFLLDIHVATSGEAALFDRIALLELTIGSSDSTFARPPFMLEPTSYRVDGRSVLVTLTNTGPEAAPVDAETQLQYILLDAGGLPLDWGFLDFSNPAEVTAGNVIEATTDVYTTGSGRRLLVLASY